MQRGRVEAALVDLTSGFRTLWSCNPGGPGFKPSTLPLAGFVSRSSRVQISHSNIDIRIVTKNIAIHRCTGVSLQPFNGVPY